MKKNNVAAEIARLYAAGMSPEAICQYVQPKMDLSTVLWVIAQEQKRTAAIVRNME